MSKESEAEKIMKENLGLKAKLQKAAVGLEHNNTVDFKNEVSMFAFRLCEKIYNKKAK